MDHSTPPLDADIVTPPSEAVPSLVISDKIRAYWNEIALYAMAASILLFLIIFVLIYSYSAASASTWGVEVYTQVAITLACGGIFFPALMYWLSGRNIRSGLEREESEKIQTGFNQLKSTYVYFGVLYIIVFALMIVLIIFGAIALIARNH